MFAHGLRRAWRIPVEAYDRFRGPGTVPDDIAVGVRSLHAARRTLDRLLTGNILPFWFPHVVDREYGGYRLHHNRWGRCMGHGLKRVITQARTLWLFARLARSPYGHPEHLAAAAHGFAFLRDRMWDPVHGGFYWEVDTTGHMVTKPDKHVCGQAFALYALSEYALASGDPAARDFATRVFGLFETHAYDRVRRGYDESFERDWRRQKGDAPNVMGVAPALKLMNTHLHIMEAITTYVELTQQALARERLIELIRILSATVVRPSGACTEQYRDDWTLIPSTGGDRVSYGHALENLWLLIDAAEVAGVGTGALLDVCHRLFEYSATHGFDFEHGGFFASGPLDRPADQRQKIWWVQAEALLGALYLYRHTGEARYFDNFSRTLDWIVTRQADWIRGDWYAEITPGGAVAGDKAGVWKSPYHNGRAVLRSLEILAQQVD